MTDSIINGVHLPKLEVRSVKVTGPVAYSFTFNEFSGWAIFTVNDATGEFIITSDWGNYSHRWNTSALGVPTLTEFLRRSLQHDPWYVIGKFAMSNKADLDDDVDERATKREFKNAVGEAYREKIIDAEQVKDCVHEIESLDLQSVDALAFSFEAEANELHKVFGHFDLFEHVRHCKSARALILGHSLLPFFGRHLQAVHDGEFTDG